MKDLSLVPRGLSGGSIRWNRGPGLRVCEDGDKGQSCRSSGDTRGWSAQGTSGEMGDDWLPLPLREMGDIRLPGVPLRLPLLNWPLREGKCTMLGGRLGLGEEVGVLLLLTDEGPWTLDLWTSGRRCTGPRLRVMERGGGGAGMH